jgi:hypothetical protein
VSIQKPKTVASSEPGNFLSLRSAIEWTMQGVGAFFVVLLARRNWKLHRTDIQGAWRVGAARFVLAGIAWAGMVHPLTNAAFFEDAVAAAED